MADENNQKQSYTAKDIYVLEGLEPVRKRPAMYIGSTDSKGLHHLIWEALDNSIDEAMAGYAKNVSVVLLPENRAMVIDDGRGIPVDIHSQTKKSALETVICTLHAGGKFGGESYKVSGGLHGVGISVVNALSKHMEARICRDGFEWVQQYSKGKAKTPVKKIGKCAGSGTSILFEADSEIFKDIKYDFNAILHRTREQAYLTPGLKIIASDNREENPILRHSQTFYFEGGIRSYTRHLNHGAKPLNPTIFYVKKEENGIQVEISLQYIEELVSREASFANNIHTPDGGSHLTGFRSGLTRVLNDYAKKNKFLKEGEESLTGDDVHEGLTAVISVKLREPQFEGQTKARLGTPEARSAVETIFSEAFGAFLEEHPEEAKIIIGKVLLSLEARKAARAAKETILRKGILEGLSLPGKLADCQTRKPEEAELFIVEGESAGGSSKMARDRKIQAILPLKGKILNVERARIDKILAFEEIKALVIALGTAISKDFNLEKLRYHKIIIATDADVDGAHIRTLLLTLFYRHFQPIIEGGYLYIATPPLYKIQKGRTINYAYSDQEKEKILKELKEGYLIQRYKGLGEMNAEQLWETTMDPVSRILKKVTIGDAEEASRIFDILMGSEVEPRKLFIQTRAKAVRNLDI